MTTDRTPPSPDAPRERDAGVRRVSRVGYGLAAAAVLGTALFGGLAAASHDTSATTAGASAVAASSSAAAVATTQSAAAPVASGQTPVASSGAS